ncbi:MAG: CPBP family glutamic-type intramembrane protease [Thermofilum sp.]
MSQKEYRGRSRYGESQGSAEVGWHGILDGVAALMIGLAVAVFASYMVYYYYLLEYAVPSSVMMIFMTAGLSLGHAWGLYRLDPSRFSAVAFFTGLLGTAGIMIINWAIVAATGYLLPSSSTTFVNTSPFYIVLFYASVGVAEECLFTIFLFGMLLRFGANWVLALGAKSILFVAYHNAVAISIFGQQIFRVTTYSWLLYAGSFLLTALYYKSRHASVPIVGHSLLNAWVQAVNIGVLST